MMNGGHQPSRLAVYTAIAGNHSTLTNPEHLSANCDYIAFVENPTIYSSSVWDIRPLPLAGSRSEIISRIPKILPHRFLPAYEISVWVDANLRIVGDLGLMAKEILRSKNICFFKHPEGRQCVFEEAEACLSLRKGDAQQIRRQLVHYRARGYPRDNGMIAGGCILRRHLESDVIALMEEWWSEFSFWGTRDQLSFPVAAWTQGASYHLIDQNIRSNSWLEWRPHDSKLELEKEAQRISDADTIFLSFPKAGRTWVRYFLARYCEASFGHPFSLDFPETDETPSLHFTHNFFNHGQDSIGVPEIEHPDLLLDSNIILLVRNPLDTTVSYFHQKHDREVIFSGSIEQFALSPIYGIERQSKFILELMDLFNSHRGRKLMLTYKQCQDHTYGNLGRTAVFWLRKIDFSAFYQAVEASRFDKMNQFELQLTREQRIDEVFGRLGMEDWGGNQQSLKVRRGQVGGHLDEMGEELAIYCANLPMTRELLIRLHRIHFPTLQFK